MPRSRQTRSAARTLFIDGNSLRLDDLEPVAGGAVRVSLSCPAESHLSYSRAILESILSRIEAVYAITTGFGKFKDVRISPGDSPQLQRNLTLSHAAGVVPHVDREVL